MIGKDDFQKGCLKGHPFSFGTICGFPRAKEQEMKERFDTIIKAVAEAADLTTSQVLNRRRFPESLDARWIAVKLLRDEGFYSARIADLMGMSQRNVNRIIYSVEMRLSSGDRLLRQLLEASRKHLGNISDISS